MNLSSAPPGLTRLPWKGKKPFYGWIIVTVGAVTQFFQGVSSQGFSTYLGYLQTEFGWSKAMVAGPRSVTMVEGAVLGPLEGFLVDRFGPRRVVMVGIIIMGAGFVLFGLMESLWMFYVSSMIIALGTGLAGLLVLSVTVNNWFRKKRTMANSVMGLGYSLAGVIGIPALVLIQTNMDWRASAYMTGIFIWVVGIPLTMLLRTRPEHYGLLPDGEEPGDAASTANGAESPAEEYDFTLREALRTKEFWMLATASGIGNLGILGAQVHLFLHLEEGVGLTNTTVAAVWMVASLTSMPSRLAGGFLGDKFPKRIMQGVSMAFMGVAVYLLAVATSVQIAFTYAVLFGIGWGMRTPILNAMQGEYFGRKSQGIIRGWLNTISLPVIIAAPVVAGYMADLQGTYRPTFIVMALIMLVGSVLVVWTKHP